jgi:hypothetical protein
MSETPTMVPVKCGMCRQQNASGLVHINDEPVFICAACLAKIEAAPWRAAASP